MKKIVIIEGYDNFSNERYIKSAKYTVEDAREVIQGIELNGSLPDSYRMNECTMEDLELRRVASVFNNEILDEVDLKLVQEHLE